MAGSKELQQHVGEKCYAPMKAWLREEEEENEVLRRVIKKLEEAVEEEETCQQQRKKEAEVPGTALPEVVEARLERAMLSRRRGFLSWLQTLCVLLAALQLAVSAALAAAVLYASWRDPQLCPRLLSLVPPQESCAGLAYEMGKGLLAASEGLWPPWQPPRQ